MCSRQVAAPILAAAGCRCHTRAPVTVRFLLFAPASGVSAFRLRSGLTAGCRTHTRGGRLPLPYSRAVVSAFSVFAPASGVSAFRLRSGSIAD